MFRTSSSSEEDDLVQTLAQSGPVLAVGRPGEKIPPHGAARIYVEDSEWQDFVRVLTYYARTIFVRVGDTSGFRWELQHLRRDCDPLKILVFFPATSGRQRNATLSVVEKELRVSLQKIAALGYSTDLWDGHVIPFLFAFTKDWEPIDIMDSGEKIKDWESIDIMDLLEKLKDSEPIKITHSAENLVRSLKAYLGELPVSPQSLPDGWAAVYRDTPVSADEQNVAAPSDHIPGAPRPNPLLVRPKKRAKSRKAKRR